MADKCKSCGACKECGQTPPVPQVIYIYPTPQPTQWYGTSYPRVTYSSASGGNASGGNSIIWTNPTGLNP
jgi:hypothetical protein